MSPLFSALKQKSNLKYNANSLEEMWFPPKFQAKILACCSVKLTKMEDEYMSTLLELINIKNARSVMFLSYLSVSW